MGTPTKAHVYSKAVPVDGGVYSAGYITFDDTGDILCLGAERYLQMPNRDYAHRLAVRDALTATFSDYEPEETVIHAPDVQSPALEIGRLPPELRERTQSLDISVDVHLHNNYQKIVYGLVNQTEVEEWYTSATVGSGKGPYTAYIDGSHHYHEDSTAISVIIVDSTDCVVSIDAVNLGDENESLRSEFLAAERAIETVIKLSPTSGIKIRTDNNTLDRVLMKDEKPPARLDNLARRVKDRLRVCNPYDVVATSRDDNTFADALANVAHESEVTLQGNPVDLTNLWNADTKYSVQN